MRKVLIITYYWPPAGGPGVQRVLKFVKYLPEFGWQPIILTVKNGQYPAIDQSLKAEIANDLIIYKTKSFEPGNLYKSFVGMKKNELLPTAVFTEQNASLKKRIAHWIRLNLFVPDAKVPWVPVAFLMGKKIIKKHNPSIIFSSSPPPTVNLIAGKLAKWSHLKWVADFRDPWTDIYYYQIARKIRFVQKFENRLEKKLLTQADRIITVSNDLADLLREKIKRPEKLSIISNGFDESDFQNLDFESRLPKFTIAYSGKLTKQQNPINLWQALSTLVRENSEFARNFQLLFIGNFSPEIYRQLEYYHLSKFLNNLGYLPHRQALQNLLKAHVLLLVIPSGKKSKGILTGKLFEYLASNRFILNIGPKEGDAAKIIEETQSGTTFSSEDELTAFIGQLYVKWKKGKLSIPKSESIAKYSRKQLTEQLTNIFSSLS